MFLLKLFYSFPYSSLFYSPVAFLRFCDKMFFFGFLSRRMERYKRRTADSAQVVWEKFFKGGLFALAGAIIIWMSVFLYIAFYYYYMPSVSHTRQVNLQFKPCEEIPFQNETGRCSYPSAHVQLTKLQQILMIGQTYRIFLKLEMPESPANQKLGMFMVCAQLADKHGIIVANSCRSTMLHYRSQLLSTLMTITFYPMLVFGSAEEKQTIFLELYSHFEEDKVSRNNELYIEKSEAYVKTPSDVPQPKQLQNQSSIDTSETCVNIPYQSTSSLPQPKYLQMQSSVNMSIITPPLSPTRVQSSNALQPKQLQTQLPVDTSAIGVNNPRLPSSDVAKTEKFQNQSSTGMSEVSVDTLWQSSSSSKSLPEQYQKDSLPDLPNNTLPVPGPITGPACCLPWRMKEREFIKKNHPVTDVYVELQAHTVEFYSASLHIQAHLTGLRYLMFHWPLLSAALGILSNLFFIVFITSVSWWQVYGPRDAYGNRILHQFGSRLSAVKSGFFTGDIDHDVDDEEDRTTGNDDERTPQERAKKGFRERSRSMIMEYRRSSSAES